MLKLKLAQLMDAKGISNHILFLRKYRFSDYMIACLLGNSRNKIDLHHLYWLCHILHCTPNDLLEWHPPKDVAVAEDHPLHRLKAKQSKPLAYNTIRQLSAEKLEVLNAFIDQLKEEQKS